MSSGFWAKTPHRRVSTSASAPVAPIDGVVIFLVTSLAMNAGDPLLAVAGQKAG